jgi:hypothetical protein
VDWEESQTNSVWIKLNTHMIMSFEKKRILKGLLILFFLNLVNIFEKLYKSKKTLNLKPHKQPC